MNRQVYFYRGFAVPSDQPIVNPLGVANPLNPNYQAGAKHRGVHFSTCYDVLGSFTDDHLRDGNHSTENYNHITSAQSYARGAAVRESALMPVVARFALNEDQFQILRGRLWRPIGFVRIRGYTQIKDFEDLKYREEVLLNGIGMPLEDLASLGVELGKLEGSSWVYEPFVATTRPEGQARVMGERMHI